jgi:hypothetical protein
MKMAQKTTVRLVDDLDGSDAVETIAFGLGGKTYEIDLSAGNAEKFREAMAEFVEAARVIKRRPGRKFAVVESAGASAAARAPRTEAQEKRAWLAANGFPGIANKRGRFTVEQDRAWENRDVIDRAAQPFEEAATVADASPEDTGVVEAPVEPGEGEQDAAQAPQGEAAEGASGTRTRISKLSSFQTHALATFAADLVVENGSSWALLKGSPEEAVAVIERVRATVRLETGEKRALAFVIRKLREGDNVKVA